MTEQMSAVPLSAVPRGSARTGAQIAAVAWRATMIACLTAVPGTPAPGSLLPASAALYAQDIAPMRGVTDRLEQEIRRAMQDGSIPSLTVALVNRDSILWTAAFGESNLWAQTPARTETVYLIGSTFKAQSTIALMQQYEAGKFGLDDAVRDYLPDGMMIRGEDPQRPVRFRHLLTHTSGMPVSYGPHAVWGESVPPPIEQYLADSLRVTGPPEQEVVYSNIAYTLVALLVERLSGVPYREYIETRVWAPLGMQTFWYPRGNMEERLAIPYLPVDGKLRPAVRTKANVWPAGLVYGTVHDQARWVMFNLGDGAAPDGSRLLQPATMDSMFTLQYPHLAGEPMGGGWGYDNPGYGLTWWTSTRDGQKYFAHSGSVGGYTAFVGGNRDAGYGIALLTNGNRAHEYLARLTNLALDLLAEQQTAGR